MNKYTNIIKFAALTFAANEYFTYAKNDLIELKEQQLNEKYNIENLNRSKKNSAEKEKATYLKKYKERKQRLICLNLELLFFCFDVKLASTDLRTCP